MVVDGDRVSRTESRLFLEMHGYEVIELSDGLEAIGLLDLNPPALDLVVLDYEMPFLSGLETLQALHVFHPGLKALLCVAGGREAGAEALPERTAILVKPFTSEALGESLDRLHAISLSHQGPNRRRSVRHPRS